MTFTTGTLTACAGGEHLTLPVTINGVTRNFTTSRQEFQAAAPEGFDDVRAAILSRLRSAVLEADATTPVAIRNAVSGKSFEV